MDVVLLNARTAAATPHWSRTQVPAVAAALAATGARVHWLAALTPDEPVPPPIPNVVIQLVRAAVPPFRAVLARVGDTAMDVALAKALRPRPIAIVAHLGFGAVGSATTLWLAERMGAFAFAAVRADEVLCHRGTLVDSANATCTQFLDAERCARCASAAWTHGLSAQESQRAERWRWLGGWSPYPSANAFLSRQDLVIASLQVSTVAVGDAVQAAQLAQAGVPAKNTRLVDVRDANALAASIAALAVAAAPAR